MAWVAAQRLLRRLILVFLGGVIGALALAPVSWPIFFFPGFMLAAFYLRHAVNWREAMLLAFFYALGFHVAGLYWISASLFVDIARYVWVLPFSAVALPCWLALLFALGALAAHAMRSRPLPHAIMLAATLFLAEMLRGHLLTGFPWNLFGMIWADVLPVAQSASLFGVYGLTLLTLLAASLSSLLMQPISKPALIALVAVWASISGFALWGEARLQANPTVNNEKILVRLVQPGITQQERKTFEARVKALSRLAQLSITKTKDWPTHLIWAETAVPDYLANEAELRRSLARIVPKNGALITGTPGRKTGEDGVTYTNSLAILSPSAALIGFYDKHHLVPFGEFVPLRGLLKAMPVATDVIGTRGDFTPGPGPRTMRAENFPSFSPLICYEAIFSGDVIDRKDPPEALLQITNDAWFGNTSGPFQHLSHARLRAIEEGLPLIRAANSGVSAVMDPMGRITASLPLNEVGVLDATIPVKLSTPTLFSRAEHTPALVFALFLMLSAVLLFAASRAKK